MDRIHQPFWKSKKTSSVSFSGFFLDLETFQSNTASDWLKQTVQPIKCCATLKYTKISEGRIENVW